MVKYIVTWTEKSTQYNPYYSYDNRHIESEYLDAEVQLHKYLSDDKDLEEFVLSVKGSEKKNIRYFVLDKEIYPKLQISVQL